MTQEIIKNKIFVFVIFIAMTTALFVGISNLGTSASVSDVVQSEAGDASQLWIELDGIFPTKSDTSQPKELAESFRIYTVTWNFEKFSDPGVSGAARRRGDAIINDIFITGPAHTGLSPKLQEKLLKGEVTPKVTIIKFIADSSALDGKSLYFTMILTNVRVSSFTGFADESNHPLEEFSLNFEEIKVTYLAQSGSSGGDVEFTWKVEEGEV